MIYHQGPVRMSIVSSKSSENKLVNVYKVVELVTGLPLNMKQRPTIQLYLRGELLL